MRSREITVGRAAKDHMVDVDLTLEVPTVCSDKGLVEQEVGVRFFLIWAVTRYFFSCFFNRYRCP